jgi:hypothetical protein
MIAAASANISTIIIAVKILGAAEGFLPSAPTLALPQAANTQHGPKMHKPKIKRSAIFRSIYFSIN